MRRVRNNHLGSLTVAAVFMVSPNHHQPGQFTMGAGSRLQGEAIHTCDFTEHLVKLIHQLQTPLNRLILLQRMNLFESGQSCHILVNFRIILHRTRTKRIKTAIDTIVHL